MKYFDSIQRYPPKPVIWYTKDIASFCVVHPIMCNHSLIMKTDIRHTSFWTLNNVTSVKAIEGAGKTEKLYPRRLERNN